MFGRETFIVRVAEEQKRRGRNDIIALHIDAMNQRETPKPKRPTLSDTTRRRGAPPHETTSRR